LLAVMKKSGEKRSGHGNQKAESRKVIPIKALKNFKISPNQSARWQKLAAVPTVEFEAAVVLEWVSHTILGH